MSAIFSPVGSFEIWESVPGCQCRQLPKGAYERQLHSHWPPGLSGVFDVVFLNAAACCCAGFGRIARKTSLADVGPCAKVARLGIRVYPYRKLVPVGLGPADMVSLGLRDISTRICDCTPQESAQHMQHLMVGDTTMTMSHRLAA